VIDALTLTAYFAERDRGARRLLARELLDIFAEQRVQASVLLRGVEGFGRLHELRSDRLLTLSEDLPAVAIAVDARERIESLLDPVRAIMRRGLITLERTRLMSGEAGPAELPAELAEAAKLTVYLGRQERVSRTPAFVAVCDVLHGHGIAGATVLLGVDGTRRGRRARATFLGRNADVPTVVVAVGAGERVAATLPILGRLLHDPLLTLERVRICKRDGALLVVPHELPATDEHGLALWQKLSVHSSQAATVGGHSLHVEIVRRLRESDAAGVTAVRGFWGFHGDHAPHGDRLLQIRRHAPIVTVALEAPGRAARTFEIIDELTRAHGLVTSEMVPALSAIGPERTLGGLRLARHPPP
jgi:PII-like signaling protein